MTRWLPLIISESIAVPLAAQLATTPAVSERGERRRSGGVRPGGSIRRPFDSAGIWRRRTSLLSGTIAVAFGYGAAWSAQVII
jgi:competence protein ComEC